MLLSKKYIELYNILTNQEFKPEVGDLFIFPSYMMHTVYPFFSDEERRSVSFNAFITLLTEVLEVTLEDQNKLND